MDVAVMVTPDWVCSNWRGFLIGFSLALSEHFGGGEIQLGKSPGCGCGPIGGQYVKI